MLLSNIYPYPAPDLAVRDDGQRLLLYLHDDPAKPHGRGTEVYALSWNGAWVPPVALTDNAQPDFAPAVAFDGEGNGVAVWERATLAPGITPALDITFTQSFEIAACAWNGTSWEDPVTLTHNALMDHAPQLSGGADGSLMAMWQSHDGFDILGTPAHPLTYTYALWDGGMWLTPTTALTGVHDVLDMAFAAYSSTHAALVTARDLDGDTGTITDTALFYSTFDGMTWAAPAQLSPADGGAMNIAPALAYDAEGKLHLLWLHGEPGEQALLWLHDSWDISQAVTLRPASSEGGLLGFSLERAPAGHVALSWQAMGEEGTELRYRLYDAKADLWSADRILATGTVVERAHRSAFGNDGTLYMAYQSVAMDFITRTLGTSATLTVITNIPRLGESNLAFLTHAVGRDLALDAFTATPANPQPGERVTLTAVLRNAGDLAVQNPQVLFCLPSPAGRTCRGLEESTEVGLGLWGGTHTLPSLAAGYTTTVSLTWQVPLTAETHMLRAVADTGDLVIETEEGNNEKWLNIPLPDISVDILYTRPEAGQLVATVRLTNTGSLEVTTPFSVAFRADQVTGTLLGSAMADIGINGWATATCALSDIAALAGSSARLWAVADAGAVVAEFNEDNNTAFTALDILPDLALTAEDIQGDGKLAVTLHNHGPLMATQVPLMVRDGSLSGGLLSSVTLASVAPGGIAQLEAQLAPGTYTLFVDIDPDNRIPELREGNNLAVREVMLTSYTTYSYVYVPLLLRTWEAAQ